MSKQATLRTGESADYLQDMVADLLREQYRQAANDVREATKRMERAARRLNERGVATPSDRPSDLVSH